MILPHFQNLGMLREQQRIWMAYPERLRSRLHVIVVDDCSPKGFRPSGKMLTAKGLASFRLFRLLKKARWNWLACRNLGVMQATTQWVLMTDIDHALPVETLAAILNNGVDDRNVYRFSRVDAPRPWPYALSDCTPYKYHPDTYLMTKALFDEIGGYDERLSGLYGTSGEFRDRVFKSAKAHVMLSDPMIRYPRDIIPDASTHPSVYTRKGDAENDDELIRRREIRGRAPNWRPLRNSFPWELVTSVGVQVEAVAC
jgi:hypothetical protein